MSNFPSIGFGAYRVSHKSEDHFETLKYAVEQGCGLIDTSANYTDGDSELLIGKVLKSTSQKPIIVSKAGYIQGRNLEELDKLKLSEGVTVVEENLKHSIHPTFLENQLQNSLSRLGLEKLDVYLLHNPEYYFYEEGASQTGYYQRIEEALLFLEKKVQEGLITEYGISSNNFVFNPEDPKATVLEEVMKIVKEHNLRGFKVIQYPLNLIELGALERFSGLNLIEQAQSHGLKTMINRPLNAFSSQGLIRLASYEDLYSFPTQEEQQELLNNCLKLIQEKWDEQENEGEDFKEIPVMKQVMQIWNNLPSPDAVDQVFFGHFFPLLAGIWGGQGLNPQESEPFYEMYEMSQILSRKVMSERAKQFKQQAQDSGMLPLDDKPLSILAVEKYLNLGVDCVLIGMKEKTYVDQFKHLFA